MAGRRLSKLPACIQTLHTTESGAWLVPASPSYSVSVLRSGPLRHPQGFFFSGEPPLRCKMIDDAGEMLTQRAKQLLALHAGLLH
jgi:hypothetical protein